MATTSSSPVLTSPLATFFAASGRGDHAGMLDCFVEDAFILDEAKERRGRDQILNWIEEGDHKDQVTIVPLTQSRLGKSVIVTVLVSGNFPGSPTKLLYAFRLDEGKIAALEISAASS